MRDLCLFLVSYTGSPVVRLAYKLRRAPPNTPLPTQYCIWSPAQLQFAVLERKIGELERQHAQREAHWRGMVEETTHKMQCAKEQVKQQYQLALAAKDGQLDGFRQELNGLLTAARLLQARQPQQYHMQ
jgi:hypothetical protein